MKKARRIEIRQSLCGFGQHDESIPKESAPPETGKWILQKPNSKDQTHSNLLPQRNIHLIDGPDREEKYQEIRHHMLDNGNPGVCLVIDPTRSCNAGIPDFVNGDAYRHVDNKTCGIIPNNNRE